MYLKMLGRKFVRKRDCFIGASYNNNAASTTPWRLGR